jgi:opacity protein-like surface antigen
VLEGNTRHIAFAAGTGLQVSLHEQVALGVSYSYYQYKFGADIVRPAGFSDRSASQGVHAYLSVWAPIFQRRPNASR